MGKLTLKGRVWSGHDDKSAPCIMCAKMVWHLNDGKGRGTAWACNHVAKNGTHTQHLYCNTVACSRLVWECHFCNVDIVGTACPNCKGSWDDVRRVADDDLVGQQRLEKVAHVRAEGQLFTMKGPASFIFDFPGHCCERELAGGLLVKVAKGSTDVVDQPWSEDELCVRCTVVAVDTSGNSLPGNPSWSGACLGVLRPYAKQERIRRG